MYSVGDKSLSVFTLFGIFCTTPRRVYSTHLHFGKIPSPSLSVPSPTFPPFLLSALEVGPIAARYGMVNVDLYSVIITTVSNALSTLVSGEKPSIQALSRELIVLLSAEVVRQGVPDHRAVQQWIADVVAPPSVARGEGGRSA